MMLMPSAPPVGHRPGQEHLLQVENVQRAFATSNGDASMQALASTSFHVGRGEFVCIVGPSGCGKTTLLRILGGLLAPDEGRVFFDGSELNGPRREIGHRTMTVCHLGNIATWLKRPLEWDPAGEQFVGDPQANAWLDRPRRHPWTLS